MSYGVGIYRKPIGIFRYSSKLLFRLVTQPLTWIHHQSDHAQQKPNPIHASFVQRLFKLERRLAITLVTNPPPAGLTAIFDVAAKTR